MYSVYITTNMLNNKAYIGMTNNNKKYYLGSDKELHNDTRKFGRNNFSKTILGTFDNWQECHYWEGFYIRTLQTHVSQGGYNNTWNGGAYVENKNRKPLSENHREKIQKSLKNNIPWNKGKRGLQSHSIEVRFKMGQQRKGEKHPMFNKHHSKETIEKISSSLIGKPNPHTKEQNNKISESLKKYWENKK